jgi:mRNA-degrading endonuclease YafQ of YafQ-DinJ toxin-antitoxin module
MNKKSITSQTSQINQISQTSNDNHPNPYQLDYTNYFLKKLKKLVKKNQPLATRTQNTLETMIQNPFDISLRTHVINFPNQPIKHSQTYSSRVDGDIRIIWGLDRQNLNNLGNSNPNKQSLNTQAIQTIQIQIIELQDIGGHSGKDGVY